jgi:hypothetical protein
MAASNPNPVRDEQIMRIEQTLQQAEEQAQRFLMLTESLRAQVHALKHGGVQEPKEKITDWNFVMDW